MSSSEEQDVSNSEVSEEESESGSGEEVSEESDSGEDVSGQEEEEEEESEGDDEDEEESGEEEEEEEESSEDEEESSEEEDDKDSTKKRKGPASEAKSKKKRSRKPPGPPPEDPGLPPNIREFEDTDVQLSEEEHFHKRLAPCKTRVCGLTPTNTKFLTIGSLERRLLKDKNVKYSELVETSMIPKYMAHDDSTKSMIKNHLQEEIEPKKLPNEFRKLHNDGSGNVVYILDDFSIYNQNTGKRVFLEEFSSPNDGNVLNNLVLYGTVIEHPQNTAEDGKDDFAPKPMPRKPRKQKRKSQKSGTSRRRMNQISIISEPMSNEKAYQKAREHMENPAFALPIQLGPNVSVLSLGSIPAENPTLYHKTDILYPVGFLSRRLYTSIRNPLVKETYESSIVQSPNGPIFRVRLPKRNEQEEDIVFEEVSASKAWLNVLHAVNKRRKEIGETPRGSAISGPEMYGIGNNETHRTIKALMEGVDNVLLCKDYVFMTNRAPSKRKKKGSAASSTRKRQKTEVNPPTAASDFTGIKVRVKLENGEATIVEDSKSNLQTNASNLQPPPPFSTNSAPATNPQGASDAQLIQYVHVEDCSEDVAKAVAKLEGQITIISKGEMKNVSKSCKSLKKMLKKLKKDEGNEKALQGVKSVLNGFISLRVNKKLVNKSKIGKIIGKLSKQNNADIKALAKTIKKNIITQLDEQERLKKLLKKKRKSLSPLKAAEGVTIIKLPPPNAIKDFSKNTKTMGKSDQLRRARIVVRNIKGWRITLAHDYSNPCLWIASKLSFFKIQAPALVGRIGLTLRAAPWYDDVFESFNRKFKAAYYVAGILQDFIPFKKKNDMTYRRVLDAVSERISKVELPSSEGVVTEATNGDVKSSQPGKKLSKPLIDEAYYFSHSRFIERILKNADDEEALLEKKHPTDKKYWVVPEKNRYRNHEFVEKLLARGPKYVSAYRKRRNKLLMKDYTKRKNLYNRWVNTQKRRAERDRLKNEEKKRKEMERLAALKIEDLILHEEELKNPSGLSRPTWPEPSISRVCGVDLCVVQQLVLAIQVSMRFNRVFQYNRHVEFGNLFELIKGIRDGVDTVPRTRSRLIGNGVMPDLYIRLMKCILKYKTKEWRSYDDEEDFENFQNHLITFERFQHMLSDNKTVNAVWQDVLRRMIIVLNAIDVDAIEADTVNVVKQPLNTLTDLVIPDGIDLCRTVVTRVMADPAAQNFNIDVRLLELDDYETIVQKPMDFKLLLRRIDEGFYTADSSAARDSKPSSFEMPESCNQIFNDATLIWQNCLEYWRIKGYHSVIEEAKEIRDIFKNEWKDIVVKPLMYQFELENSPSKGVATLVGGETSVINSWRDNNSSAYFDEHYEARLSSALEALRKNEYELLTPDNNAIVLNFLIEYILSEIQEIADDIEESIEESKNKRIAHRESKAELRAKLKEKIVYEREKEEKKKQKMLKLEEEQRKIDEEYARRLAAGLSRRSTRAVQRVNYDETSGNDDGDKYKDLPTIEELDLQHEMDVSILETRFQPLGLDRFSNKYIIYPHCFAADKYPVALFVEHNVSGKWYMYKSVERFDTMLTSLNVRGVRESALYDHLSVRAENVRQGIKLLENTVRGGANSSNFSSHISGTATRLNYVKDVLLDCAQKTKLPRTADMSKWQIWVTKVKSLDGGLSNAIPLVLEYEEILYSHDILKWASILHERRLWRYACSTAKTLSYLLMKILELKAQG